MVPPLSRPKSELLPPSFPLNVHPSQPCCATPESHSFSSLQGEQGSFSLTGDPTQKLHLSTHKSPTSASDAFRFLEARYAKHLPPTPTIHGPRGYSANDAVAESSWMRERITTSRVSRIPFVRDRMEQTLSFRNDTRDRPHGLEPVWFPTAGGAPNASPSSHISHSKVISPLISPLDSPSPVLNRIQPYSLSFSRSHFGTNVKYSPSGEITVSSPSQSLWESSRYSPPDAEWGPRTPKTAELIQGSPRRARRSPPTIVVSPSPVSSCDYFQEKELASDSPAGRYTAFADRRMIRTSRSLHTTSATRDREYYDCHVPVKSVYMQPSAQRDQHTRITRVTPGLHIHQDREGPGISFNFDSGNNILDSDSVGDWLNNDYLEITPGRPTVVLVPSGRRTDCGEAPASASGPASVKPEVGCAQTGPLLASGLGPHSLLESTSQSSISRTTSFHTAQEDFVEAEHPCCCCGHECGDKVGYTRAAIGEIHTITPIGPSKLRLGRRLAGPGAQVSSPVQGCPHHGTQLIIYN
ncbi:hypothetical protein CTheo_1736 [Ceratobasidium theobromae]|uniref:Uncharacterized protein n=1 Tax=Ceratobasidium theobromae TaxID=1582974 RepID=A0A5N5QU68_9AGAM|nr:hypothetical protein CTheo_1736 [Ceratobasidium theobromae]